jgi:ferric-dicitrate binding protein FerR (iron transport regulator)
VLSRGRPAVEDRDAVPTDRATRESARRRRRRGIALAVALVYAAAALVPFGAGYVLGRLML